MATYTIEPARDTLHGTFSRGYPPILTIDSGDTVLFRTLNSGWVLEPPSFKNANVKHFEPRIEGRDDGHALCGPIAIRGAKPGITLEIRINEVRPDSWGWTGGGGWDNDVNRRFGLVEQGVELIWMLDANSMTGRDQYGHIIALRPFMGVMGMPPDEMAAPAPRAMRSAQSSGGLNWSTQQHGRTPRMVSSIPKCVDGES